MKQTIRLALAAAGISTLLAGCGGGGDDTSTPAPAAGGGGGGGSSSFTGTAAQGLFAGTASNGRTVTGLVLDDGTYYFLYSLVGASSTIAGVVQGSGSLSGSSFTSSNGRDFSIQDVEVSGATVSATVDPKKTLKGTITYPADGTTIAFDTSYDASYETPASLATIAGRYTGSVQSSDGQESATVTISASGAISGAGSSGCTVSGSVAPRSQGNVYNVSVQFGGSPCLFANQTLNGAGFYLATSKRVYLAAPNAARTDGVLFVGVKP